jgi:tRNA 2-selenouridine synthase
VRSNKNYLDGHIPGAISFPLLKNEERAQVGTCYKNKGNFEAVILGYELVGPRFPEIIRAAKSKFEEKPLFVHCWRGGLRSRIMTNLLASAGFQVYLLKSGYKNYRNFVLNTFSKPYNFQVLSGYTGSGKTEILEFLKQNGKNVVDLEALANHRGSAFGGLGFSAQPTQEQFENNLAELYCFPNPAHEKITISNSVNWSKNESPIFINEIGQEFKAEVLNRSDNKIELSLKNISKGFYILQISNKRLKLIID